MAGRGGLSGTFADFEADIVPIDGVDGRRRECHFEVMVVWRTSNWRSSWELGKREYL
jgi:hypothetical protein